MRHFLCTICEAQDTAQRDIQGLIDQGMLVKDAAGVALLLRPGEVLIYRSG